MNRVLLRRIVCAVDLSEQSVPSLKRALQLAHLHGGELFVAHVTNGRLASTESETRKVTVPWRTPSSERQDPRCS
jgi:hypothetical protein